MDYRRWPSHFFDETGSIGRFCLTAAFCQLRQQGLFNLTTARGKGPIAQQAIVHLNVLSRRQALSSAGEDAGKQPIR
jgi:hypothetical protein